LSVLDKLIINAAVTGTVLHKSDTPHLPTSVREIVDTAKRVREAGASIIHLHARNADQSPCHDPLVYCELVDLVREATDLVINVSLSGRFMPDVETRAAPLTSRPDLASLTVGSMNFISSPSVNAPDTIRDLAARIYAVGAVPELEVFEAGFANFASYLARKGVLRAPHYANVILGSLGAAPLDLIGLGHIVGLLPAGTTWSVGGLGQYQLDANVLGIAAGGHVRVGLEDNIHYDRDRRDLADNQRLVARIARIGREMGREPATPAEARAIIGLPAAGLPDAGLPYAERPAAPI
jgi:3-keto-5-aminohexanoate cleavage enzyme